MKAPPARSRTRASLIGVLLKFGEPCRRSAARLSGLAIAHKSEPCGSQKLIAHVDDSGTADVEPDPGVELPNRLLYHEPELRVCVVKSKSNVKSNGLCCVKSSSAPRSSDASSKKVSAVSRLVKTSLANFLPLTLKSKLSALSSLDA